MRHATRPNMATLIDSPPAARLRAAVAAIDVQVELLLGANLSEAQRRSALGIARHAQDLARELAEQDTTGQSPSPTSTGAGPGADLFPSPMRPPREEGAGAGSSRGTNPGNPRVLIADDDADMLELLTEVLGDRYELTLAHDGAEAVSALAAHTFSLAIVDLNLPVLDGFAVAESLRSSDRAAPPFMFLSAQSSAQAKVRGLALGAADYVTKPFDPDELTARIARIIAAVTREASLRADAMTDSLTGLCNYRSFTESLRREIERSRRYGHPLSLLTVDLDHLKTINDEHGHDVGNEALVLLSDILKRAVRRFEVVARHGGDEFAVLLPNTDGGEALSLAERLRHELRQRPLHGVRLSVSIGVACRDASHDLDAPALVKASDEALYRAKRAGRDRAELARGLPGV